MSAFLEAALDAVGLAEKVLRSHFRESGVASDQKNDGTPVTVADKEAEKAIVDCIKVHFPGHSIVGEESGFENKKSEYVWIVDPIDGTKNFARGMPFFGALVALMHNGKVIVGVSNMPMIDELLYAEEGKGVFLNGRRLERFSTPRTLKDAYVSHGSLGHFKKKDMHRQLLSLSERVYTARSYGNQHAYHLMVRGWVDAVIEARTKVYDVAPFQLILEELGGKATQICGNNVDLDCETFLAASSPELFREVQSLMCSDQSC